jgi:hypothetical protein
MLTVLIEQACLSGQDDGPKQDDIILLLGQSSWVGRMMPVSRAEFFFRGALFLFNHPGDHPANHPGIILHSSLLVAF